MLRLPVLVAGHWAISGPHLDQNLPSPQQKKSQSRQVPVPAIPEIEHCKEKRPAGLES
jgi:hypothetical protein